MYESLERLVMAESPSVDPAAQADVQAALTQELEANGFRVRRLPGRKTGGHLLGLPKVRNRNQPIQALMGHCDTVWPRGTLSSMPITIRAGHMTGPGIYDMKGGLVLMMFALRALANQGLEPEVLPVVLINSDEEIGSGESRRSVERLAKIADRVFVLEPAMGQTGALKTARKFTRRSRFVAFRGGYHGDTLGARKAAKIEIGFCSMLGIMIATRSPFSIPGRFCK